MILGPKGKLEVREFSRVGFSPLQIQAAEVVPAHLPGRTDRRWAGWIIGRSRFSPRQQLNIEDGKRPFFPP